MPKLSSTLIANVTAEALPYLRAAVRFYSDILDLWNHDTLGEMPERLRATADDQRVALYSLEFADGPGAYALTDRQLKALIVALWEYSSLVKRVPTPMVEATTAIFVDLGNQAAADLGTTSDFDSVP